MVILYYHIPLRDTGYLNRKKVLDMISRYKNPTLMCAHTHYFQPYHMRSHKLFERIHGGTCGYFWRSNCGGDGTPNGFMVYEIDGTKIVDTYFKASQRPDDHQIRLYHGDAVFAGPYATYKYDLGADVVVANVFTSGMDGTTWKSRTVRRRRQDVERHDGDGAELRRPLDPRLPHRGRETSGGKRHQPLLPPIPVQAEKSRKRPASWFVRPTVSTMPTRRRASTRATISPKPRVIDPPGLIYRAGSPVAARQRREGGGTG